jgi:predicted NBD/HSP70 family sugar kinase
VKAVTTTGLLVGVDFGTSACKAGVVTLDGRELAHGRVPTPWRQVATGAEIEPAALVDTTAQIDQLQQGQVQALIVQKPVEIGRMGVEQAVAALNGEPTEAEITTDFVTATEDNLEDPDIEPFLYRSSC